MRVSRWLLLAVAVLALGGSNLFAQCAVGKPLLFAGGVKYLDLTGAPNVPGEFCSDFGGTPTNGPPLRVWQFDADWNAAQPPLKTAFPAPYQVLWSRSWMCNTQTLGTDGNDAHFFQWGPSANLNDTLAQLQGCTWNNERVVAEVSYGTGDGTATHSGFYAAFTVPFDPGLSMYNFDDIDRGASGDGMPLSEIPQPTVDAAEPDSTSGDTTCCYVQVAIPNPVWYTDAGDSAQVRSLPANSPRDVVKGYRFMYSQTATPGPTSTDPGTYTPVLDPADCATPLGVVPLGAGGQTQVRVAVPATAATTPYYIVALPVYEENATSGALVFTTTVVSKNSVQNPGSGQEAGEVGFFPCFTTLALEFESFAVKRTPEGAKIEWTMTDEEDLAYYAVEKRDYYALGGYYTFPDGVVESEGQLRYSYTDRSFDPTLGQDFFRIVAYKYDGTSVATPAFTFKQEITKSPRAVDRTRSTRQDGGLRTRSID
jgi:hypothetical protein